MKKRVTDKQRMDWIEKHGILLVEQEVGHWVTRPSRACDSSLDWSNKSKTARKAIDAELRRRGAK